MTTLRTRSMLSPAYPYFLRSFAALSVVLSFALAGCDGEASSSEGTHTADTPRQVYALGRLEPANGVISISAIPGERLKQLAPNVIETKLVPTNGILGVLASYDVGKTQLEVLLHKMQLSELKQEHEVKIAEAQLAQAEAGLAQAQAKQEELELHSGKLEALGIASQLAKDEYDQLVALDSADDELVTAHQLAKQENQMEMANQEFLIASQSYGKTKVAADKAVDAAHANIKVAKMTLDQLDQGYDKKAIEQEIKVAKETLKRSILQVPDTTIQDVTNIDFQSTSDVPTSEDYVPYTVLKTFVRPGEFITQLPILKLGDLREMVCIAELYEADVNHVEVGQAVTISSPALKGEIAGTVELKGSLIAPPGVSSRNPLAPADRSVVEVRIKITDKAAIEQAAKLVGLQVTVKFGEEPSSGDRGGN